MGAAYGGHMTTSFAQDILPKFRPGDIGCMTTQGIRIGDGPWMCDPSPKYDFPDHGNARHVYERLTRKAGAPGQMPPGRKWAQGWLDTYQQWMTEGFDP